MIYDESHCKKNQTKVVGDRELTHTQFIDKSDRERNYLIKNFQLRHDLLLKLQCNV